MSAVWAILIGGFCVIFVIIQAYRTGIRLGQSESLKSKAEEINEKALEAKRIHDRLMRDDEYADRVRSHFKR